MRHEFEVKAPDAGRRVDRFVQSALGNVPGSLVQRLLRQKKIRVNGARAHGEQVLAQGDTVVVHHDRPADGPARTTTEIARTYEGPPITVLAEEADLLFVDKPASVACSDDGQDARVLALWLAEHLADRIARGEVRPEPCHRLDRGTTGVVAVALTAAAFERFRRALEHDQVQKQYEVVVWGAPEHDAWRCTLPLVRRAQVRADEPRVIAARADEAAWDAVTEFEVIARGPVATRLRARPLTGRTHQIRAHCLAQGWPVVGDPRYGDRALDANHDVDIGHALLHARCLRLEDAMPPLTVCAPWPTLERRLLRHLQLWPEPTEGEA